MVYNIGFICSSVSLSFQSLPMNGILFSLTESVFEVEDHFFGFIMFKLFGILYVQDMSLNQCPMGFNNSFD